MDAVLLQLEGIEKVFPGVRALDNVNLSVKRGEVHGLIGENGAGKSTLIKILTGYHDATKGRFWYDGTEITHMTPRHAMDVGIACIYQELNLFPELSVVENIFIGRELYALKNMRILDRKKMLAETIALLKDIDPDMNPKAKVNALGVGQQQMVEIAKAVHAGAKLLIMDEPTASLGKNESEKLFQIIKRLKEKGVTIIFISHRLDEVKRVCDTVTVLRDGKVIGTSPIAELEIDDFIKLMVGRTIQQKYPKIAVPLGAELFSAQGIRREGVLHDISFSVRSGEILGFSGLVGSGRTELARAITGVDKRDSGKICIDGKQVNIRTPRDSIRAGIAFLTEDRKRQGLVLIQTVEFNTTLASLNRYKQRGFLQLGQMANSAEQHIKDLNVHPKSIRIVAGQLSGGNQQKVVIAKWLLSKAKVFIFDEPTRGIDVGAKVEVYNLINVLVKNGAAVIMISSEMEECMGMSDRIIVMHEGRVTGEFNRNEFSQEKIMYAQSGIVQ